MELKETRFLGWLETKAGDETGTFTGYGSTYNPDLVGDKILPGAFSPSIKAKAGRVPLLMNHLSDTWAGHTVDLAEDAKGLYVKGQLFLDTIAGRDAYGLLKNAAAADVRVGLSIGFIPQEVDYQDDYRIIKQLDLWEISFTPFAAQPKAFVTDVKTERDFEKYLREAGNFSRDDSRRIVHLLSKCNLFNGGMPVDANRNQQLAAAMKGIFA